MTNLNRKEIGEFLRIKREEKGISTYAITKNVGLRFETIKSIEDGTANYTIGALLKYLNSIGCTKASFY